MKFRLLLLSLMTIAILVYASARQTGSSAANPVQVIAVKAKKYEFSPSPIRVKQGTRVQLKVTAIDHVHGFRIADIPEGGNGKAGLVFSSGPGCQRIEKGDTATIEFVAQTPGTYPFKCCVHCGWRHRSMHGELIVEP